MSLRLEFVSFAQQEEANIRGLCRRFGVSPATAYKWLHRFQERGTAGLEERPRRPLHSPSMTSDAVVAQILSAARQHPAWGARKLKHLLEIQGQVMPAVSTIQAILQRNGLHIAYTPRGEGVKPCPYGEWADRRGTACRALWRQETFCRKPHPRHLGSVGVLTSGFRAD
ncbi:hypothetical protein FACS189441_3710 [Betaproteobacteria bacterium]|nr:hypothetical protein FACS189441_3710 [Betaproteobacteria bacterium]